LNFIVVTESPFIIIISFIKMQDKKREKDRERLRLKRRNMTEDERAAQNDRAKAYNRTPAGKKAR